MTTLNSVNFSALVKDKSREGERERERDRQGLKKNPKKQKQILV